MATGAFSTAAFAEGDAAAGEDLFKRCKSCHGIANGDDTIVRGGRTGPNLFGIIGMTAGAVEGFRYGDDMVAAGEAGLVWDEETLAEYITDPTAYLRTYLDDDSARAKMTFKLRSGSEDMAAYLATFSPAMEMEETAEAEDGESS
ncbi:MAG: cytochrome C [Rhodobacteraceae bacterium]|nr:cytochrome C [Paracoccaceae bacterium]